MKKFAVLALTPVLLLSFVACSNTNKKILPDDKPPIVQDSPPPSVADTSPPADTEESKDTTVQPNQDSQTVGNVDVPSDVSNEKIVQWMPGRNKEHNVPVLNGKYKSLLDKYNGYFVGDTSSKIIYLTFDEGYENGYTGKILDILKDNNVKAAFFVTKPYIKSSPDLVKRMVAEGHIVGNHTDKHPSLPDKTNAEIIKEITNTSDYFKEVTGVEMPKYLRPPMGEWSERSLYVTDSLGYKTVLWSMAHRDWEVNNQPGKDAAIKFVDTYYHNGAILLLHAVSQSNTEALDTIIKNMQSKGYRFATLDELN